MKTTTLDGSFDVVVVGGGLSGLAAATYLGRSGLRALVLEKASELGGRARTTHEGGYALNFGAHALYREGPTWGILGELGVPLRGGVPSPSGALALADDGPHALPRGLFSLLTTGLLSPGGKLEFARTLGSLGGIDAQALACVSAHDWLERVVQAPSARALLRALFRVATYADDLDVLSAGAAIEQLRFVSKHNVLYLDGGWQTLVEALRERATVAGALVAAGEGAARVEAAGPGRVRVLLHDGRPIVARAALLATGPHAAAVIAPGASELARHAQRAHPAKVATLDVALSKLPRPHVRFGLGTSRPTYLSVHSAAAKLAPPGGAVVHAMLYRASADARADEREVEGLLDQVQPGWRAHVVRRRFLPAMVASNDLVAAARGGYAGRPDVDETGAEGVFIAGDWVGPTGMLLDAALASAKRAALACAARLVAPKPSRNERAPLAASA